VKNLIKHFIPRHLPKDEDAQRKARLTVSVLLIIAYFNVNYIIISLLINYSGGLLSQIPLLIISITTLFLYKSGFSTRILYPVYFISCTVAIAITVFYTNGFLSVLFPWLASTPIVAVLVWSKKGSRISLLAVLLVEILFFWLYLQNYPFPDQIINNKPWVYKAFYLTCNLGLVLILYWIAIVFENAKDTALKNLEIRNKELETEKAKSEALLLNILPEEVANELKDTNRTTARSFDYVSVMFLDIKDFTILSEQQRPEDVIKGLDEYFEAFDRLVVQHNLEKIKTIGDAYMCAAGLPSGNENHAPDIVHTAFLMLEAAHRISFRRKQENKIGYELRVGINSGPVVAGVVGIKKFAYDIWGDTVNTAARMQQMGEAGKINISGTTYELVKDKFTCTYRGKLRAKHKGDIDMYFVDGPLP